MELRDARTIVTGASSGIGRAIAIELAAHGARVSLAAHRQPVLEEVAERIRAAGGTAIVVPVDVTVPGTVENPDGRG